MATPTGAVAGIVACWDPVGARPPALEWAAATARSHGHRLVVYSSYAALRESLPPSEYREARQAHEADVGAFAADVADVGAACTIESTNDDVRVDLFDTARRHRAELIVVGVDPTSSGPGLFHIGSVTEFIAHHTDLTLAVIRSAITPPERLAVFVDGTAEGVVAVRWAAVHAGHSGGEVTPVVLEPGVRAASQLVAASDDIDADLVVVGAPPLLDMLGRRVGGLALKLLHTTERSLVIVPRGAPGVR